MISLATTTINDKVRANVKSCLDEGMIGGGRFVKEFEEKTAKYVGVKHAIAVCNGSMADIIALAVLKYLYPDKKTVVVPALTFIAQTNAVLINRLTPVFVDVGEDYQMKQPDITHDVLCVMPANLLGKRCNVKADLILEDSCEAFGFKPRDIGTYSFYPSHTITTGEGGMIVTDNDKYAELARTIRNHGRKGDDILDLFHFDTQGFNGKMSNLSAAIGVAVIDEADKIIRKRKKNVALMNSYLKKDFYADSPHAYPVLCDNRDEVLLRLEKNGIEARKLFSCLPTQEKVYRHMGYDLGDFPVAEDIGNRGLFVPIHQNLNEKDIKKISDCIRRI